MLSQDLGGVLNIRGGKRKMVKQKKVRDFQSGERVFIYVGKRIKEHILWVHCRCLV